MLKDLDKSDDGAAHPIINWDDKKTGPRLTYAWNWFNYHAQQRLTAFHYFLIIVGFLMAGYITCLDKTLKLLQAVIGFVGIVISLAFWALDIRNGQLVDDGRDALRKLERALDMDIHRMDYDRLKEGEILWLKVPTSHGVWFRRIQRMAILLFLLALICAI
jgi:hypothetical protein